MRYRALDANNDSTIFSGNTKFLVDSPDAVAQAVRTKLLLMQGEWFLDVTEGTPYATEILGKTQQATADAAIKTRVLTTQGVNEIIQYSSNLDKLTRKLTVDMLIDTIYGQTQVTQIL